MKRIQKADYPRMLSLIDSTSCGAVYPRSIAEGRQSGEIFAAADSVLFWHCCGFAFLYGAVTPAVLDSICRDFLYNQNHTRRFMLFAPDAEAAEYFRQKPDLLIEKRLFFTHTKQAPKPVLPAGFSFREIDGTLFTQIKGKVPPSFSWDAPAQFLANGKGFCVMNGSIPAAWAFSAAVSSDETDIGVETAEAYQGTGLGTAAASRMMQDCAAQGRSPVWACHAENQASQRLALRLGFTRSGECCTVKHNRTVTKTAHSCS